MADFCAVGADYPRPAHQLFVSRNARYYLPRRALGILSQNYFPRGGGAFEILERI